MLSTANPKSVVAILPEGGYRSYTADNLPSTDDNGRNPTRRRIPLLLYVNFIVSIMKNRRNPTRRRIPLLQVAVVRKTEPSVVAILPEGGYRSYKSYPTLLRIGMVAILPEGGYRSYSLKITLSLMIQSRNPTRRRIPLLQVLDDITKIRQCRNPTRRRIPLLRLFQSCSETIDNVAILPEGGYRSYS